MPCDLDFTQNNVLQSLVATVPPQSFKFVVYSTIIQHAPGRGLSEGNTDSTSRGMHAASAALWNSEKDGMWSFRYGAEDGEGGKRGFDVVITVVWIAT